MEGILSITFSQTDKGEGGLEQILVARCIKPPVLRGLKAVDVSPGKCYGDKNLSLRQKETAKKR